MSIKYIVFNRSYRSIFANYTFHPGVKYIIKQETPTFYYTIKNVRIKKVLNGNLYNIFSINV